MDYSPIHEGFILKKDDLQAAVVSFKAALASMRKVAGVPVGKRDKPAPGELTELDHAEREILNAARFIGIDFGVTWGYDLDLTGWEN